MGMCIEQEVIWRCAVGCAHKNVIGIAKAWKNRANLALPIRMGE